MTRPAKRAPPPSARAWTLLWKVRSRLAALLAKAWRTADVRRTRARSLSGPMKRIICCVSCPFQSCGPCALKEDVGTGPSMRTTGVTAWPKTLVRLTLYVLI